MKIIHLSLFVLFFFTIAGATYSQNLKENELVVIQGEKIILHQVRTGETIYSISRDFKIDSSQLLKQNPKISEGLNIGEVLKIPFNEDVDLAQIPNFKKGDPTGFINHTIESRGETAYAISKQYGISVEEIYAYNPTVNKLKKGMTLKIPQWKYEAKSEVEQTPPSTQNSEQKDVFEHTVVSGETLFSIGKKYQISESEILLYNPGATNLKAGSKLYLPKKTIDNNLKEVISDDNIQGNYINHTVVSGETLYGITKKYQVSENDLLTINPDLKSAFRAGTVIRIPVKENIAAQVQPNIVNNLENQALSSSVVLLGKVPEVCQPRVNAINDETITVALFLPLFLDANEQLNKVFIFDEIDTLEQVEIIDTVEIIEGIVTDTIIEKEKPVQLYKQFYGNSEKFLQFYEGVLIAVDSMQKAGMKIELNVFDTKDNPASIRQAINQESFLATDLIIGPVYENVQKEVAQIAAMNHIPMISPFTPTSGIISSNQQFFQVNPTREYIAEATAEMIATDYSNANFIVVRTSSYEGTPEGQLVDLIRKKFAKSGDNDGRRITDYDFRKERSRGLPNILLPDKENVVFIPTSDEGELSVAISNINNLADDYSITLIGVSNYQQKYPSIEVAHFHNLKLRYINPYWVDYNNSSTINYIDKFISNFGTEPNNYGVQGFDVAWYFLNALQSYGKDFEDCLPFIDINLLQGKYYFQKVSPWGGFMNQGVSVISYNRNFEVERKSVIGKPKFKYEN